MFVSRLLRFALIADAVATAATGLAMLTLSGVLEPLLGLPETLMYYVGLGLLPYAALVGYLGWRASTARGILLAVIIGNLLWALDSMVLLIAGWITPTVLGYAFVIAQAVVVGVFAELQFLGLRQSKPAPWDGQRGVAAV